MLTARRRASRRPALSAPGTTGLPLTNFTFTTASAGIGPLQLLGGRAAR